MTQDPSSPLTGHRRERNGREERIESYQARYDRESIDELITTVTLVVAAVKGIDPLDCQALPIMYESVDMQALENTFFEAELTHKNRTEAEDVNFFYAGCKIRLRKDGWVTVYEKQ